MQKRGQHKVPKRHEDADALAAALLQALWVTRPLIAVYMQMSPAPRKDTCWHDWTECTCVLMIGLISTEDKLWLVVAVAPAAALAMNRSLVSLRPVVDVAKLPLGGAVIISF